MDTKTVALAAPFEHIHIETPYEWGGLGDDAVYIGNERTGTGNVWTRVYAKALAEAILAAIAESEKPQ